MALVYSSNQQPTTSADAFYRLITLLVSAGWTVAAAGDGLSAYSSSSGSAITSSSSGANGFNNNNAWIFIKMPGSNRGFVFQVITAASNTITIRYFGPSTAVTNTPSATTAPASTTPNAASQDVASNVAYVGTLNRVNYWADNTAPYGFGMHGWDTSGVPTFHFILEALQANTYHPLNQDPYVMMVFPNSFGNGRNLSYGNGGLSVATLNMTGTTKLQCWIKYNMTGSAFRNTTVVAALLSSNTSDTVSGWGQYMALAPLTISTAVGTFDGKDEEHPMTYVVVPSMSIYVASTSPNPGGFLALNNCTIVGTGTYIKNHIQYRSATPNLDVLSVNSTYDRLCFGNCTVPNGGVFPTIP